MSGFDQQGEAVPTLISEDFLGKSQEIGSMLGKACGQNNPVGKTFEARWRRRGGKFSPIISGTIAMTKTYSDGEHMWAYLFPVTVDAAEKVDNWACHTKVTQGIEPMPVFVVTNKPGMETTVRLAEYVRRLINHEVELRLDSC